MYIEVYILDAPYHIDRPFDYSADMEVSVGDIVKVPFGRQSSLRLGAVTKIKETVDAEMLKYIKPVHSVLRDRPTLSGEMLGLCLFMKEYTLCTFGEAVKTLLPPGALSGQMGVKVKRRYSLCPTPDEARELLSATGRAGIKSAGQRAIIEYLLDIGSADEELVRLLPGVTPANIRALADKGILAAAESESIRNPYAEYARERDTSEIILSEAQTRAYDAITPLYEADEARAALLFGVTGSGKTKVIMKAIDRTIADGRSVIMLVPEISLTPQTVGLFCRRYGERVAVVHSSLSQGERADAWRRIKRGDVDLVIGTRSAVFAPLDNIGLIVIDEEHEHTYKSESDPKYHARDIAAFRSREHGALMLLASATPSLESFYKAERGIYTLIPLRERYGGAKLQMGNKTPISGRLMDELLGVKERGEQAILFLNRRGYSSQVSCKRCGEPISCPHCSVTLTYHTGPDGGRLLCHLCGYSVRMPRSCPGCGEGGESLSFVGFGTQKLEGEITSYLPEMPVMRMAPDTTSGTLAYDRMLDAFRGGGADILLGTQMVAKGHDFPRVTLVGVALADTSLYVSDFRAAERTFSLLTQVIGRAGRATDRGVAVIQTFAPTNETIRLACAQDYERFYRGEIAIRRALSYPPFCDMVQLTVTSDGEEELKAATEELSRMITKKAKGEYSSLPLIVFAPTPAQVYKLNEKYRMRVVVKCKLNPTVRRMLGELISEFSASRRATLTVDLNPLSI